MNFEKMYLEEDLLPGEITSYEKRDYGFLFYNEENKESFDSNHAIIYREKVYDVEMVLRDIIDFYKENTSLQIYRRFLLMEYPLDKTFNYRG